MFNVYIIHKILLYVVGIVNNMEIFKILMQHDEYRKYINKNYIMYEELIWEFINDGIFSRDRRIVIYRNKDIKMIKTVCKIRDKINKTFIPYGIKPLYTSPQYFNMIEEEIRYYAVRYEWNKELIKWMIKEKIFVFSTWIKDEKLELMIEKLKRKYEEEDRIWNKRVASGCIW